MRISRAFCKIFLCLFISIIVLLFGFKIRRIMSPSSTVPTLDVNILFHAADGKPKMPGNPPEKRVDIDQESEKDSTVRKRHRENVCNKTRGEKYILELPGSNRKRKLQQWNLLHHLIVNEKHKVVYCFIPKIACTNMKKIFLVLAGRYPNYASVKNIDAMHFQVLRMDDKKFTTSHIQYMLKDYYKFMLVRDPFERLVSAYRNKWLDKSNTFYSSVVKNIVRRYDVPGGRNEINFTKFVRHIVDTPSESLDEHWTLYNDLCRPCDVNYNFIGSIDTISRDITHVMRQINVNETKYYMPPGSKDALIKTKQMTANFLKQLPEKLFNDLVKKFRQDHELFGYTIPDYNALHSRYNLEVKH